jgi:hypothetical protein
MRACQSLLTLIACILMFGCTALPGSPEAEALYVASTPQAQLTLVTGTPNAQPPRFSTITDSEGNEVSVSVQGEAAIFAVHSQSGIGSAAVELLSGAPPRSVVLRLHLQGLEQFRLLYGETVLTASVSSSDASSISQSIASSQGGEQQIAPGSPFWLDVRVVSPEGEPRLPLEQGYFEISLPEDLLRDGRTSFSFEWIDFYRF